MKRVSKGPAVRKRWFFHEFGIALEPSTAKLTAIAVLVGLVAGVVAQGLLELIYLFTSLFFYGRFSFAITSPAHHHLGAWVILIPPAGGLMVGLMVYFWEPTLKGHGIPEAMEAVLINKSHIRTRVAILKPLATALAIGTGGPFGAEGPIIQTGAAFGSIFGRYTGFTPYQRRVLLACGAAGGMAATFTAPMAGVLLAIELLLFEFRARSFIPVAIAAATATAVRIHFAGWAPLFPAPAYALKSIQELWLFAVLGLLMGAVGIAMIRVLYALESWFDDFFLKPAAIWAPAAGALVLGIIGYFYPQIFGTGYDTIRDMLNGRLGVSQLLGISIAKFWALVISLGSGTTGGVFAPSLIVGGGIGAAFATACGHLWPGSVSAPALYALVAMAAVFAGIARAPFTSILFLFELSRNPNAILPLIVACMISDGFVRLMGAESIMTGKLANRGLIVLQDYSVPEAMRSRVKAAMSQEFITIPAGQEVAAVRQAFEKGTLNLALVVEEDGTMFGVIEAHDLLRASNGAVTARDLARREYVVADPAETVDRLARRMIRENAECAVVVGEGGIPVGVARASDLLQLRRWVMEEEGEVPAATGL